MRCIQMRTKAEKGGPTYIGKEIKFHFQGQVFWPPNHCHAGCIVAYGHYCYVINMDGLG